MNPLVAILPSPHARRAIAVALALGMTACGPDAMPVAPNGEVDVAAVASASTGPWIEQVTGGGTVRLPTGEVQNLSVRVARFVDGSVEGRFSVHARFPRGQNQLYPFDFEWEIDVALNCLVVDGDRAWMSGKVSRLKKDDTPFPFGLQVGADFLAVAVDRSTGMDDDQSYGPAGAFGTADCADRPDPYVLPPGIVISAGYTIQQR